MLLLLRWRDGSLNNNDYDNTSTIVRVVISTGDLINRDETHYGFDPNDPLYPLTIKQVTLDDEAKYWCEVFVGGVYRDDTKEMRIRGRSSTIRFVMWIATGGLPISQNAKSLSLY